MRQVFTAWHKASVFMGQGGVGDGEVRQPGLEAHHHTPGKVPPQCLAPAGVGGTILGSHHRTKGPICAPEVSLISRMNMFSLLRSSCWRVPKPFSLYEPGKQDRFALGDLLTATWGLPAECKHPRLHPWEAPDRSLEHKNARPPKEAGPYPRPPTPCQGLSWEGRVWEVLGG